MTTSRTPDVTPGYVLLSPDGTEVILANSQSFEPVGPGLRIWPQEETLDSGTLQTVYHTHLLAAPLPVYSGSSLFMYYSSGVITVVDLPSGEVSGRLLDGGSVTLLAANQAGNRVYALSGGGTDIIDTATLHLAGALPPANDDYFSGLVAVTDDQLYTYAATGLFSTRLATAQSAPLDLPNFGEGCGISQSGWATSPDEKTLLLTDFPYCNDIGALLYRTSDNSLLAEIPVASTGAVAFSPDSTTAYIAGSRASVDQISVLTIASANTTVTWSYPSFETFGSVVVSPDGSTLYALGVSGGGPGRLFTINTADGSVVNGLTMPASYTATAIALTPDGKTLVITLLIPLTIRSSAYCKREREL